MAQLKKINNETSVKTKLNILNTLTVMLVRSHVSFLKENCDAQSPLEDHLLMPKAHREFLALNGIQLVEDLGPL